MCILLVMCMQVFYIHVGFIMLDQTADNEHNFKFVASTFLRIHMPPRDCNSYQFDFNWCFAISSIKLTLFFVAPLVTSLIFVPICAFAIQSQKNICISLL